MKNSRRWSVENIVAGAVYLILDKAACGSREPKDILEESLRGGVSIVQFRDKASSTKSVILEAQTLFGITKKFHVPFLINDRLDVCLAIDADGLHVGQEDVSVALARKILGKKKIIGLSCHSMREIVAGGRTETDYLAFGPVFRTQTKDSLNPQGLKALGNAQRLSQRPLVAIGGITVENIGAIAQTGCTCVAVCRSVCLSKNPRQTASRITTTLKQCIGN